jgi:TonB-linked SusC/RagA family outer membrane protein
MTMRKLYKKLSLTALMALLVASIALGQERVVSGTVTDEDGASMPGVNVLIKGTNVGTATDANGQFRLSVPSDQTVLVISFIGYQSSELTVGSQSTINVTLAADVTSLDEIIVTGYAVENRRDVTGAVSTVKTAQLVAVPTGNIEQALQGRVSGVTVITNGQPGTSSVVRLRGFGSVGGNEPLYVVDGVPVTSVDFLNPLDIETTTVLKDAASASVYGARAAGGVIVYTTKRGKKSGKMSVSYDGLYGVTVPGKVDNILNPQEQADWTWEALRNTGAQTNTAPVFKHDQYGTATSPVLPDWLMVGSATGVVGNIDLAGERTRYNTDPTKGAYYLVMPANKAGTNWYDEITQVAPIHRHTLGFSGGNESSTYYMSLGMQDQDGTLLEQNATRYTMRLNSDHTLFNKLKIGQNLQATYISNRGIVGGNGGRGASNEENVFLSAFRMPAIIPVRDAFGGYSGTAAKGLNNPRNPVAERERSADNGGYAMGMFGNVFAELEVMPGLTLRSTIGGTLASGYFISFNKPSYENSENGNNFITYNENSNASHQWTFTNTARYQKKFGIHALDILAGYESLKTNSGRSISGSGQNPFSPDPNYISLSTTSSRVVNSGYSAGFKMASVFGTVRYTLMDKYTIGGVLRRDGSSKFGANNRYGVFPAISASWRISDEAFMQSVPFISDLKIRGGWGQMGNSNNVVATNNFSLYQSNLGQAFYDLGGTNGAPQEGFFRSQLGNPDAKWETSITSNIGIDAIFMDGKFELVFDFWKKDTEDLLYQLETPAVVGPVANDPSVNIAKMSNKGLDIMLINRGDITSDLKYEATFTGSFLKNEIVSIAPDVPYFESGGTRIGNAIRNQVGGPISSFFGYKVIGLFQNAAEVAAAPAQEGKGVGRFRYEDTNGRGADGKLTGVPDGKIDVDDRTYIGDPVPAFTGGINLQLNYKQFELVAFLYTSLGFENYNFSRWFTDFYPSFTGAAYGERVRESFTFENGGNTTPIFENISNTSTNNGHSTYYIEKGNYARLTNLQLAYKLPATVLSRWGVERAKIYLQGTNLITMSKYSGLDPGVGGNADTTLGLDFGTPPVNKGFNIGLSLGF